MKGKKRFVRKRETMKGMNGVIRAGRQVERRREGREEGN
jgi:hypothetical protein